MEPPTDIDPEPDPLASWAALTQGELADHIEYRYHARLRLEAPLVIDAAMHVQELHGGTEAAHPGLVDLLLELWDALQEHMDEEQSLVFPMFRRGSRGPAVYRPVLAMQREHHAHVARVARLRRITAGAAGCCHACRALDDGVARLEAELLEQIEVENDVLFLRATRLR